MQRLLLTMANLVDSGRSFWILGRGPRARIARGQWLMLLMDLPKGDTLRTARVHASQDPLDLLKLFGHSIPGGANSSVRRQIVCLVICGDSYPASVLMVGVGRRIGVVGWACQAWRW